MMYRKPDTPHPSDIIAHSMCELARKEALAREACDWRTYYAMQAAQRRLSGVWVDLRNGEAGVDRAAVEAMADTNPAVPKGAASCSR